MIKRVFASSMILAALTIPSFAATAATEFYVAQDAKTHACMVSDQKPDGKMMMDAGTKAYASKNNAEQAMAKLKVCATAAPAANAATTTAAPAATAAAPKAAATAPAASGFYVAQDTKTHKCMVDSNKPDGKAMMDVGTKVYQTKARADQAMSMLKACK